MKFLEYLSVAKGEFIIRFFQKEKDASNISL